MTETTAKCIAASRSAISALINSEGDGMVCDKSAYPSLAVASRDDAIYPYHLALTKRMFPSSKNIQIIRDPRDVLVSSKHYFGITELGEVEVRAYANSWSKCNMRWALDRPDFVMRFEDLKHNFEETVVTLLKAIELNYDQSVFDNMLNDFKGIELSRKADPGFYRLGMVGEWKEGLSEAESVAVSSHAAMAMELFGYE